MSLFPAYAPPGTSRKQTEPQNPKQPSSSISAKRDDQSTETLMFVVDKSGTDVITIDSASEGELRSSDSNSHQTKSDQKKSKYRKSSGSKRKKRSRSRSPSKSNKSKSKRKRRRRSSSVEVVERVPRDSRNEGYYNYDQGRRLDNNRRAPDWDRPRYENDRRDAYNRNNPGYGGGGRGGGKGQWGHQQERVERDPQRGRNQYYEEQQRLNVAQRFPQKVFLEEVNLKPEFAFRVDTEAAPRNLNFYSLSNMQKSFYQNEGAKVVGASEQELSNIYSKFSKFRCIYPQGIDKEGNPVTGDYIAETTSTTHKRNSKTSASYPKCSTEAFISLSTNKQKGNEDGDGRVDITKGFESFSFSRKDGELNMKERIEQFNKQVREDPRNIPLWKAFIDFQDKVFEESNQIYDYDNPNEGKGSSSGNSKRKGHKKRNRKALVEKKVAILEKALESSPKNLELHLMRLNFLYEIHKPNFVLTEWKNLVTSNQQVTSFWIEYLRFASTQLQLYSSSSITSIFQNSFKKFRQMLNPKFPEFQRPFKFPLVISDLLFLYTLVLRNSGHKEKAMALHQAQLELDFSIPEEILMDKSLLDWTEDRKKFELFWDIGTPKFGENGAPGWAECVKSIDKYASVTNSSIVGISETKVASFEDTFFETANQCNQDVNDSSKGKTKWIQIEKDKARHWLLIESTRNKVQWLPWRAKCSDVEDVDDTNRLVLGSDISPFAAPIPFLSYISDFDRQSAHFRHLVNFLITLQEDFVPQSQAVSSVLTPFASISLTESRSLFSELVYWRKLLNLYVPEEMKSVEESGKPTLKTPEGFRLLDLTTPNLSSIWSDSNAKFHYGAFDQSYPETVQALREEILSENQSNITTMLRTVVDKGVDVLEPHFGRILFEMYLRFEQKNTIASQENPKARMKLARNMMKKESLRNSMGCYREMAMLEYFQGNKSSALNLTVKTINLGCTTFLEVDTLTGTVDLDRNWETVTELTMLYTRLAEFHLVDKPQTAFHILGLLGNGFKPVNLDVDLATVKTNVVHLKALRHFEKIFAQILPGADKAGDVNKLSAEALGRWDGDRCVEYLGQKGNLIVEWTRAFALFQFLAKDFEAASQVFEKVMGRVDQLQPLSRSCNYDADALVRHYIREQLYVSWCNLGAHVLSKDPMANAKFRSILGSALEQYPSNPALLLLFTDVENQMSIAGKLWRMMVGLLKQDGGCNHWAPLLMGIGLAKKIEDLEHDEEIGLDWFGLGGPAVPPDTIFYKLDALLTAAQQNSMTRNCPLIWRVHLKLLAIRAQQGKDEQRAKATFYDAVRHCPSAKALYLDGVTYFPEMLKEITDLMAEKQLYIRLPVEELEVLLEIEEEAKGSKPKNKHADVVSMSSDEGDADKSDGEL